MLVKVDRTMDFSQEKTQLITLEELRASRNELRVTKKPMNGITHIEAIDKTLGLIADAGLNAELSHIYVSDNNDSRRPGIMISPEIEDIVGAGQVQAILFNRVLARINIFDGEDDESNGSMAISFHQRGIDLAYGQNVKICSNMSILSGTFVRSYGSDKVPLEKMFELTSHWVQNHLENRKNDLEIMNKMKETRMDYNHFAFIAGMLRLAATRKEKFNEDIAPFNKSQLSHYEYEYCKKYFENPSDVDNLWKVYNLATQIHHPGSGSATTELPQILQCNAVLGKFIKEDILK